MTVRVTVLALVGSFATEPAPYAIVLLLLALSGFYSGAETAVVSARRARLEQLAGEGRRDARRALQLLADTPKAIAMTLVGTNISNIGATSLGTALAASLYPEHGPALATLVMTPVILFGAEIVPKALFRARATRLLRKCSGALGVSEILFAPLVWLTSGATRALLLLFRLPDEERRPVFRREDLENVFLFGSLRDDDDGPKRSPEKAGEGETMLRMAGKALDLSRRTVTAAVVPIRPELTCPTTATVEDACERFRHVTTRFLAVVGEEGDVEGFVAAKQLVNEDPAGPLAPHVRPASVVDSDDTLDEVIQGFRRHQHSIALVRDPEGETLGVVTPEDVLEEIVGDLARIQGREPGRSGGPRSPERKD